MKKKKGKMLLILAILLVLGIYYYVTIPAINIHASGFWVSLIVILVLLLILCMGRNLRVRSFDDLHNIREEIKESKLTRLLAGLIIVVAVVYLGGSILSSPIVNAKKYQKLLEPETGNFTEDIDQVNYNQIPLLDKDSAELLGNRKMGSMVDMVSQF